MYRGRRVRSYLRPTEEQIWMYGAVIVLGASAKSSGKFLMTFAQGTCVGKGIGRKNASISYAK